MASNMFRPTKSQAYQGPTADDPGPMYQGPTADDPGPAQKGPTADDPSQWYKGPIADDPGGLYRGPTSDDPGGKYQGPTSDSTPPSLQALNAPAALAPGGGQVPQFSSLMGLNSNEDNWGTPDPTAIPYPGMGRPNTPRTGLSRGYLGQGGNLY